MIGHPGNFPTPRQGFTLIELSVVLVIIGLLAGGILVGRDMIAAAETRAQVTQIERYNIAVNIFQDKYRGLPGDLRLTLANQFGFTTTNCTGGQANRDGTGLIDGKPAPLLYAQAVGETGLFWQDLSMSGLIPDAIPNGGGAAVTCNSVAYGGFALPLVASYFPAAKIGKGNYLYVYESAGRNWFGLLDISGVDGSGTMAVANGTYALSVRQAFEIDSKVDDGIPTTGTINVSYVNTAANNFFYASPSVSDTAASCLHYFVGGVYTPGYSTSVDDGSGLNCSLSFRFQR